MQIRLHVNDLSESLDIVLPSHRKIILAMAAFSISITAAQEGRRRQTPNLGYQNCSTPSNLLVKVSGVLLTVSS